MKKFRIKNPFPLLKEYHKILLIMRLSLIFIFFTIIQTTAAVFSQNVSIDVKDQSMREVLKKIEIQSNYRFFYNDQLSGLNNSVTLRVDNKSIKEVLEELLAGQQLSYRLLENNMIVIAPNEIAQQQKVSGTVTDASTGEPLVGVSIAVEGTTQGTITDVNGKYTLESVNPNAVLVFSYIGYNPEKISIAGQSTVNLKMVSDMTKLDEIVVVGYGVQKKKLVTGATVQVSGDKLAKLSTTSAFTAIQSQSPGVNITQNSGQPGDNFKVTIRGMGTIGNYAPLYVIDGVAGGDLNSLNPSDIESFDVLKDAASASIYGSRAANGVVLITTKRGKAGKLQVSYDGYYGIQNVYKMPPLLNAKEYMTIQDEIAFNEGSPLYNWKNILGPYYDDVMSGKWKGTNWLDKIRNVDAPIQNHSLNITGGNDVSKFSMGLGYSSQEGILGKPVQAKYQRTTFRLNSEHVLFKGNGFDAIKFEEMLNYNYSVNNGIGIGNQYGNDISNCLRAVPIMPKWGFNGKDYFNYKDMQTMGLDSYWYGYSNPIATMINQRGYNINKSHGLNAAVNIQIQPIKNLVFKSQFGYKMNASSYRLYKPAYDYLSRSDVNTMATVQQNMGSGWSYTLDNTLNYKFNIQNHHIDVLVGQSMEKWGMGENSQVKNGNLLFSDYEHAYLQNTSGFSTSSTQISWSDPILNGNGTGSINAGNGPWVPGSIASFFGRINYDWKETYMLTLIMRADGSSQFAKGKRWGSFPSVSAGWVISNENFMKSTQGWMDFLKLRASWGQNGNCNIKNFQYLASVSFDATAAYSFGNNKDSQTTGGYANIMPNPDVTWETSEQTCIGIDARLLKSRLSLTLDWYKKTTKDWLIIAPILSTVGTGAPYVNGGDVENKGYEIAVGWNDRVGRDFTYGMNVSLAFNKNNVTRIANAEGIIHGASNVLSQGTLEMFRVQEGYPIGYFYGYKTAGIFQNQAEINAWKAAGNGILQTNVQPGDIKFVDVNHDGVINSDDKGKIGDPNPHTNLGLSLNIGYKGFDLIATAHGAYGQQIAKSYRKFADSHYDNYTTDVFQRWHGEGTSNKWPRLISGNTTNYQQISDIYIEDGDYLKIQNITIGYDFKKLFPKMPFAQVRLYATAQNLYTFTKYTGMDPEIGSNAGSSTLTQNYDWAQGVDVGIYPNPRTFLFGINLKF